MGTYSQALYLCSNKKGTPRLCKNKRAHARGAPSKSAPAMVPVPHPKIGGILFFSLLHKSYRFAPTYFLLFVDITTQWVSSRFLLHKHDKIISQGFPGDFPFNSRDFHELNITSNVSRATVKPNMTNLIISS